MLQQHHTSHTPPPLHATRQTNGCGWQWEIESCEKRKSLLIFAQAGRADTNKQTSKQPESTPQPLKDGDIDKYIYVHRNIHPHKCIYKAAMSFDNGAAPQAHILKNCKLN